MTTAYKRLARLAELQEQRAASGELGELDALRAEVDRLVASLPVRPPADARPELERAERALRSLQATLEARLAETGLQLGEIARGRRLAHVYGAAQGAAGAVDAHG